MLDTYNLTVKPTSDTWYPPTNAAILTWSRPGRGAGTVLVTHENGAGLGGECVLFVRRNGTASVLN